MMFLAGRADANFVCSTCSKGKYFQDKFAIFCSALEQVV